MASKTIISKESIKNLFNFTLHLIVNKEDKEGTLRAHQGYTSKKHLALSSNFT